MPSCVLMENAGRQTADVIEQSGIDGSVCLIAGHGNNGGDCFVAARHLNLRGYSVRVLLVADSSRLQGDAKTNRDILGKCGISCHELGNAPKLSDVAVAVSEAAWTIDGLLGTGTRGEIREPYASVIECVNESAQQILAVDVPSGLDCDTGRPLGPCIKAAHTVTFVSRKAGFDAPEAGHYTGQVHIADIGVPRALLKQFEIDEAGNPPELDRC